MTMLSFAQTSNAIAATTKKLEKIALVATYLRSIPIDQAAIAAIFLSGRPFPAYEEATLQVGGSLLWRTIGELSGKSEAELTGIYRRYGDAGSVAEHALAESALQHTPLPEVSQSSLSLSAVQHAFSEL